MVGQESLRNHCLARRSPSASDLSGVSVVPTAAKCLVVHNHKRTVAKLISAGVGLDTVLVGRNLDVTTVDWRTRHQRRLHSACRRVEQWGYRSRRKPEVG